MLYDVVMVTLECAVMIARKPFSISLTPELHAFNGSLVETSSYAVPSEVIRAGLRLLQGHQTEQVQRAAPQAVSMTGDQ